jgi:hypothetical protein
VLYQHTQDGDLTASYNDTLRPVLLEASFAKGSHWRWVTGILRSEQEVFDGHHDVRCVDDERRQAEACADGDYWSAQRTQHQGECFNRAHPFQAAFGRKPQSPAPRRTWMQALGDQRQSCLLAQDQVDSARRRLQAMAQGDGIRAVCR